MSVPLRCIVNVLHLDEQRGWRGGEQQASWLIQGLVDRGHRVHLAGRPDGCFLQDEHGGRDITRVPLALRNEGDLLSAWKLARHVSRNQIDIIHAHTSHAHMIAVIARRFADRGCVVAHRRVSFPPRRGLINRWKYNQPDRLVCVSGKVREVLAKYGIPDEKLALVYSAVDWDRANVDPVPRAVLNVAEDAPLIVSAGALVGHKDHATLLRALPGLMTHFPNLRVLIAGEGALRAALEDQVAALALTRCVTLLGHRSDAPAVIRAADCYVSSSWSEGLGTSVLEALAGGVPVVAAEAGGIPEMVKNGETGWLVPNRDPDALANAIVSTLKNRETARAMAERGIALARDQFSVEAMVNGNLAVYEAVLAERNS